MADSSEEPADITIIVAQIDENTFFQVLIQLFSIFWAIFSLACLTFPEEQARYLLDVL